MEYLEDNELYGYLSTRKLSRKLIKYNTNNNPYSKDNFIFDLEKNIYIYPLGQILDKKGLWQTEQKQSTGPTTAKTVHKKKNVQKIDIEQ